MAVETLASERRAQIAHADEELLASLGYKQEFKRAFTPFEVFGIAFSIIALLPSIASCLVYSLPYGGPVSMVWGWLTASVLILFVGLALAELASAAPTSGGQTYGIYIAILFTHALVCSLATEVLARLQSFYVALNLILFFGVLIALPAATPTEFMNPASFALGGFTNLSTYPAGFAYILSWLAPVWTIGAYDSCVHISEEASNAAVAVPWAIIGAIGISGILGTAMNIAIAFCMGTDLEAIIDSDIGQPLAAIFFNSFGQKATLGIWSVVVLTQWGMGSSIVLATSRQVFAFSRDGAMPFSRFLYRMNSYTKTPVNTVWFSVFISALLGLLAFAGEAAIGAVFAYSIPIGARFLFKGHNYKPGPFNLGVFGLPVAIVAIVFMTFISVVFLFPTELAPAVADMNYAVVVMGGVMIGCLIWYWFPKYGGVNWFEGPVTTVEALPKSIPSEDNGSIEREKEKIGENAIQ
ncbi:APC amino acid permease, partial [Rhizoctonia solani]